jgi:sec-independent protein translocase protein TatA
MFGLGTGELLIILFIALVFIGPKKLPELARGLGRGIREFQKAKDDFMDQVKQPEVSDKSLPKGVNDTEVVDSTNQENSEKNS